MDRGLWGHGAPCGHDDRWLLSPPRLQIQFRRQPRVLQRHTGHPSMWHGWLQEMAWAMDVPSNSPFRRICPEGGDGERLPFLSDCTGTLGAMCKSYLERWLSSADTSSWGLCHKECTDEVARLLADWLKDPGPGTERQSRAECEEAGWRCLTPRPPSWLTAPARSPGPRPAPPPAAVGRASLPQPPPARHAGLLPLPLSPVLSSGQGLTRKCTWGARRRLAMPWRLEGWELPDPSSTARTLFRPNGAYRVQGEGIFRYFCSLLYRRKTNGCGPALRKGQAPWSHSEVHPAP